MKQVLVVALVVVLVFIGIPVVMGMPMAECAECDLGVLAGGVCMLAVLTAAAALVAAQVSALLRARRHGFVTRLVGGGLERPPRLA